MKVKGQLAKKSSENRQTRPITRPLLKPPVIMEQHGAAVLNCCQQPWHSGRQSVVKSPHCTHCCHLLIRLQHLRCIRQPAAMQTLTGYIQHIAMPKEDNLATAIGNMHKKIDEDRTRISRDILTERQTNRQTFENTVVNWCMHHDFVHSLICYIVSNFLCTGILVFSFYFFLSS